MPCGVRARCTAAAVVFVGRAESRSSTSLHAADWNSAGRRGAAVVYRCAGSTAQPFVRRSAPSGVPSLLLVEKYQRPARQGGRYKPFLPDFASLALWPCGQHAVLDAPPRAHFIVNILPGLFSLLSFKRPARSALSPSMNEILCVAESGRNKEFEAHHCFEIQAF